MSTSPTKAGATADKAEAGTAGKVVETKGSTTMHKAETKDSGAKEAPKTDAKAAVSDTKTANSDAKTPETGTNTTEVTEKAKELIDSAFEAAAGTTAAAETEKMVDIKVLRSHPRLAYSEGDKGSIPQSLYDELLADGKFFEKI